MPDPRDKAAQVRTEHGYVILIHPDGTKITLTPDAAVETSDRLLKAALKAAAEPLQDGSISPP